jgi:hypothetical protein
MAPHCRSTSRPGSAIVIAAVVLAIAVPALAALPDAGAGSQRPMPPRTGGFDLSRHVDANRVNMFTTNFGSFAWDIATGASGFVWPRGSGQTAVFASGLWLGCQVGGETRIAAAEYSSEYGPGAMVGGTFDTPNRADYRTYKVVRWTGNPADSEHVDRTPAELAADPQLDPLAHHAWSEYIAGAKPYGAPTRIYHLPDTSTPQPDDSVDVEGPDVMGDEMLWEVHNDADPSLHTNNVGLTAPLGVEIQQTTFVFDRANDFGDIVFLKFRIQNKGANTLDQLYLSLWSDPDLGNFTDDLVGCDVGRALGFAYNGNGSDAIYGTPPPALGYVLLRGAADPVTGTPLGLTAFSKYINGTDPNSFAETYNYMRGLLPNGSDVIDPTTSLPTRYFVPGDPVTGTGWLDSNPSDRRMLLSSGPTRMLPGQTQEVWGAIVIGRGTDRLASVATVRCLADLARSAYQAKFSPLPDPGSPCHDAPTPTLVSLVSTEASVDHVTLRWYSEETVVASVERRAEGEDWMALGHVAPGGDGMLVFEDHDVVAGGRYDYRLAIATGGGIEHLGETRVDVPSQAELAFLGTRPSPGDGRFVLSFSLATREPARIEVLDVAGRRMLVRDLTGLVPGSHALALDESARFPAGIYLVRISQGARRVTGKAAIIR